MKEDQIKDINQSPIEKKNYSFSEKEYKSLEYSKRYEFILFLLPQILFYRYNSPVYYPL